MADEKIKANEVLDDAELDQVSGGQMVANNIMDMSPL